MRKLTCIFGICAALVACHDDSDYGDSQFVYSSGFSFSNYQYVIVEKPGGHTTSTDTYGLDVELADVLTRHNMKVIDDGGYELLSQGEKNKTLLARMGVAATNDKLVITVSFDDMLTGHAGATVTTYADGNLFKSKERKQALDDAAKEIVKAFQHDKGPKTSDSGTAKKSGP